MNRVETVDPPAGGLRRPGGVRAGLRRLLAVPLLLLVALVTVLMPSRHGWLPLWPSDLAEVVYRGTDGAVRVGLFEIAHTRAGGGLVLHGDDTERQPRQLELAAGEVLAVTRPLSASVVVGRDGTRRFGYLAGLRPDPDARLSRRPENLERDHHGYPRGSQQHLLLRHPGGDSESLPAAGLERHYRPNRMGPVAKLGLFLERFARRWLERIASRDGTVIAPATEPAGPDAPGQPAGTSVPGE